WVIFLYSICFTAKPTLFPGFRFHGAFRSREMTWDCVQALVTLLKYVGHLNTRDLKGRKRRIQGGYVFSFRQVSESWVDALGRFFEGKSTQAMEDLVLALIENAGARRKRRDVQDHLDALKRFWKHEALSLKRARERAEFLTYPVPQEDRDRIFLQARFQ